MARFRFLTPLFFPWAAAILCAQTGAHGSAGKLVAPGIQVLFSQNAPNSCSWRFRNTDPARTLESMRFTYTYSSAPLSRVPLGSSANQSSEDTLTEPLAPAEESRSDNLYKAPANCATVTIHVTAAQWI